MRTYKICTLIFVILLVSSFHSSANFVPGDENVQSLLFIDVEERTAIDIGTIANFTIVIKNLSDDTASNITVIQQIPSSVDIHSTPLGEYTDPVNVSDVTVTDTLNDESLNVPFANVTDGNFTINFDITMPVGSEFALDFSVNMSQIASPTFTPATVSYYDGFGDRYDGQQGENLLLEVQEIFIDTRLSYIQDYDTTEPNYTLIITIPFIIAAVAIFSRMLYLKKPV